MSDRKSDGAPRSRRYTPKEKAKLLRIADRVGIAKAVKRTGVSSWSFYRWRRDRALARSSADPEGSAGLGPDKLGRDRQLPRTILHLARCPETDPFRLVVPSLAPRLPTLHRDKAPGGRQRAEPGAAILGLGCQSATPPQLSGRRRWQQPTDGRWQPTGGSHAMGNTRPDHAEGPARRVGTAAGADVQLVRRRSPHRPHCPIAPRPHGVTAQHGALLGRREHVGLRHHGARSAVLRSSCQH